MRALIVAGLLATGSVGCGRDCSEDCVEAFNQCADTLFVYNGEFEAPGDIGASCDAFCGRVDACDECWSCQVDDGCTSCAQPCSGDVACR